MSSAEGMVKSCVRHSSRRCNISLGKNMDTQLLMYIFIAAVMINLAPAKGYEVLDGQDSFRTRPLPKLQNHSQRSNAGHSNSAHDIGNPVDPEYEYYDDDEAEAAAFDRDYEYDYEKRPETRKVPKEQTVYEKSKYHDYYSKYDDYYPIREKKLKPTTQNSPPTTTVYTEQQTNPTQKPISTKIKTSRQHHQKEYQNKQITNNSRHQQGDKREQGQQQIKNNKPPNYRKKQHPWKTDNGNKRQNDRQQPEFRSHSVSSAVNPIQGKTTKPYYVTFQEHPNQQHQNHHQKEELFVDHHLKQSNRPDQRHHQQQHPSKQLQQNNSQQEPLRDNHQQNHRNKKLQQNNSQQEPLRDNHQQNHRNKKLQQNHREQEPLRDEHLQQRNQQQHHKQLQQQQERDYHQQEFDHHYQQQQQREQQKSHQPQQDSRHHQHQQKNHQLEQQHSHKEEQKIPRLEQQHSHKEEQKIPRLEQQHSHKEEQKIPRLEQQPQSHRQRKQEEHPPHFQTSISESVHERTANSEDQVAAATGHRGNTRAQFHEQGIDGPHSYKFGYNTGDSFNPMARYEERDADGFVRGSYSFVDALGKHQVVYYESHPEFGFRTRGSPGSHSHSGF